MSSANGQGFGACFPWIPGFPFHFHSLPAGGDESPKSVIPRALHLERMKNDAFSFLTTWREWDQQLNPSSVQRGLASLRHFCNCLCWAVSFSIFRWKLEGRKCRFGWKIMIRVIYPQWKWNENPQGMANTHKFPDHLRLTFSGHLRITFSAHRWSFPFAKENDQRCLIQVDWFCFYYFVRLV